MLIIFINIESLDLHEAASWLPSQTVTVTACPTIFLSFLRANFEMIFEETFVRSGKSNFCIGKMHFDVGYEK